MTNQEIDKFFADPKVQQRLRSIILGIIGSTPAAKPPNGATHAAITTLTSITVTNGIVTAIAGT